jgi:hypothetical protein
MERKSSVSHASLWTGPLHLCSGDCGIRAPPPENEAFERALFSLKLASKGCRSGFGLRTSGILVHRIEILKVLQILVKRGQG